MDAFRQFRKKCLSRAIPNPQFIVNNLAFGEVSEFVDVTTIPTQSVNFAPGYTDPTSSIDSIWWNFGEGIPVSGTHEDFGTAYHQFSQGNQEFPVNMEIKTNLGCFENITIKVSVLQSIDTFPYVEDFETFNSSAFRPDTSSWQLTIPNGAVIQGTNKAWVTSNPNNRHKDNENSFVALPAFDLRSLLRPMLSMDIWSNAESTRDGTVLQYSYDGGNWITLVDPNENIATDPKQQIGVNWYNEKGLVSRPGDKVIDGTQGNNNSGYGWTGVFTEWKTARFPLDEIRDNQPSGLSSVRFRVVFGSDQQNPDGTTYDGFAFDNLFIGEREHNVLFEHFDNLNSTNIQIENINSLAKEFSLDLIPLGYHNNYPSADIIYNNNKYPVETRGSIYDINQSPRSFMDGIKEFDFSGSIIENYQIINRSLISPLFDISIITMPNSESPISAVDIQVTITARDTLNEEIIVNVMPIERSVDDERVNQPYGIDSLNNVVKDMLPSAGYPYNLNWSKGSTQSFTVTWDLNKLGEANEIYDNTKLAAVVFVQNDVNEGSREVYQAAFTKLPVLENTTITGLENELNLKKFEEANIYPNPAKNFFDISLSDELTVDTDWSIIDQRGVELLHGTFIEGQDKYEVNTKSLPNGLFMFIVRSSSDNYTIRKIIIQR